MFRKEGETMSGQSNLIPNSERSPEQLREQCRKGGKRSGEVRKQKKAMKDVLQMLLDLTVKNGDITKPEDIKSLADIKGANVTVNQAILLAQINKALKGDTSSAVFVRDTSGNKLAEEMNIKSEIDSTISEIQKYVDGK